MFGYVLEVVKRPELHTFRVVPKRWIVERELAPVSLDTQLSEGTEEGRA
jgi:hypothetical protein